MKVAGWAKVTCPRQYPSRSFKSSQDTYALVRHFQPQTLTWGRDPINVTAY